MRITVEMRVDAFNDAMKDMTQRLRGSATLSQVVRSEVGKVVGKTMAVTKKATELAIVTAQLPDPAAGKGARKNWRTYDFGNGMKKYFLSNRYPDGLWANMSALIRDSIMRRIRAIGLAKQQWADIARKAGLDVKTPGYVLKATPPHPENSTVAVQTTEDRFGIGFSLRGPGMAYSGSPDAFRRALAGRTAYYRTSVAKGVFNDLAQVAARYKGIGVQVPTGGDPAGDGPADGGN